MTDGLTEDAVHEEEDLERVPLDLRVVELEASCFGLDAMPDQWSIAPEGELWLQLDDETWRVLDRFGRDDVQSLPVGVRSLQALGPQRAIVIADGQLLDVDRGWPQPLLWPASLGEPALLCGDPSTDGNGFVAGDRLVHREHGRWWSWTGPENRTFSDVRRFAQNAGVCVGEGRSVWLGLSAGESWRLSPEHALRFDALGGAERVVFIEQVGIAAQLDGDLVVGDGQALERYRFEAGDVSAVSAARDVLWVQAGEVLHRMHDGTIEAVEVEGAPTEASALAAEAGGGLWTLTDEQACHLRSAPPVRLHGVYNLQRVSRDAAEIGVSVHADATLLSVKLDGAAVPMTPLDLGEWRGEPQVLEVGWHDLEVEIEANDGSLHRRRARFERLAQDLTWHTDIKPLFEEHCSGSSCHGPGVEGLRADLSSWEGWTEHEDAIRARVLSQQDMPPLGTRKASWGLEAMNLIRNWFDTGAVKGEP